MTPKNDYDAGWEAGRNTGMLLAQQQTTQPIVIRVETAQVATPPKPQRRMAKKRWLLSAIFAALLLFKGVDYRHEALQAAADLIAPARGEAGPIKVDGPAMATAIIVNLSASRPATIVPTPGELPQATPVPTIGTGATVPQEQAPTPVAAQQPPPPAPPQDVQSGNAPAVQAPPPPVAQPAPAVEAPPPPAPPTAAPTAEPEGQVVAASQDAPVNASGEPAINYDTEIAKWNTAATAQAFANGWQGVKP